MGWNFIIQLAIGLAVGYLTRPEPQTTKPQAFRDITVPGADLGKTIPVFWGRRWLEDPNIAWYGDLRTRAIKD